ncbi:hypothetical protein [Croceicoccus marinus]|uniref:Gluconate 2-dehydrogenase subunit 3 family protein n=1 Tax=Croceicoccus marinus TaxID=450378 RepID=A0A7G6VUT6_9SPHN|nr:hypothetical protein [Croceicoccus marinus]QNE05501.1 hypothetical protein H4O24_02010 [Croceicoccus marinus]
MADFIPRLTRRNALIGGGAGAVLLAGGGAFVLTSQLQDFYADLVRHYIPHDPIAPGAAEAFAADYLQSDEDLGKVRPLMYMQQIAGFAALDEALGGQGPYETFVRRVATRFMMGSNFFQRSTPGEPVQYYGIAEGCGNPFARFA